MVSSVGGGVCFTCTRDYCVVSATATNRRIASLPAKAGNKGYRNSAAQQPHVTQSTWFVARRLLLILYPPRRVTRFKKCAPVCIAPTRCVISHLIPPQPLSSSSAELLLLLFWDGCHHCLPCTFSSALCSCCCDGVVVWCCGDPGHRPRPHHPLCL